LGYLKFLSTIRKVASDHRFEAWSLTGRERDSGESLGLVYAGRAKNKSYIANLAFKNDFSQSYLGKKWLWDVLKIIRTSRDKNHLLILEINKRTRAWYSLRGFYVPVWLDGETSFKDVTHRMKTSQQLKGEVRRIRKSGFTYEVTQSRDSIRDFYNRMYRPHTLLTYGSEAVPHSLDRVMGKADQCDLLLVKQGVETIAGELIVYEHDGAHFWCNGVVDGNYDYVQAGALAALYYYRYIYLSEKGYDKVYMGASRAFLKDGVLQYKKKWGMRVTDGRDSGFLIHPLQSSAGVKRFLINNPFVYNSGGELLAAEFIDAQTGLGEKQVIRHCHDHLGLGIKKTVFYTFDELPSHAKIPGNPENRIEYKRLEL